MSSNPLGVTYTVKNGNFTYTYIDGVVYIRGKEDTLLATFKPETMGLLTKTQNKKGIKLSELKEIINTLNEMYA